MKRPKIIAGNWKMYKTIEETIAFVNQLKGLLQKFPCHILIAPPFTSLAAASTAVKGTPFQIGAQNMSGASEGAYTGEISARMLKDAGATFVIIGHSERRAQFFETDEKINEKIKKALAEGLTPLFCIGESEKEREEGRSVAVLTAQLDKGLKGIPLKQLMSLVIAYEPVWAIGTGKAATPSLAEETHRQIRSHLEKSLSPELSNRIPILYGGSVKPDNIGSLLKEPNIDGALVGGASLDPISFQALIEKGFYS